MLKMHKVRHLASIITLTSIILAAPLLFFGGPTPTSSPIYPAVWNLGHIVFFALIAIWLRLNLKSLQTNPNPVKFIAFSCLVLVLGLGIEWTQYGLDRNPDWHDIWRNLLGAWLGWFSLGDRSRRDQILFGLLGLFLMGEFFLVGQVTWNDWRIQNQLPLICALEKQADMKHWTGDVSLSWEVAIEGQASLKVQLSTDEYSGTGINRIPRDWRNYQWLVFELFIPDNGANRESLRLALIVYDRIHYEDGFRYDNRFNKRLVVGPGWNHFQISLDEIKNAPANRQMDMANIFHIGLFTSELEYPQTVFLDYFRLE